MARGWKAWADTRFAGKEEEMFEKLTAEARKAIEVAFPSPSSIIDDRFFSLASAGAPV